MTQDSHKIRQVPEVLRKPYDITIDATQLFLSESTVRNYVSGIFTKLDVTDHTQAAIIALWHRLVD